MQELDSLRGEGAYFRGYSIITKLMQYTVHTDW